MSGNHAAIYVTMHQKFLMVSIFIIAKFTHLVKFGLRWPRKLTSRYLAIEIKLLEFLRGFFFFLEFHIRLYFSQEWWKSFANKLLTEKSHSKRNKLYLQLLISWSGVYLYISATNISSDGEKEKNESADQFSNSSD